MILLYSSIVGYDRHVIISLGRGISIYGGLFLLQLRLIINYINSLFKIGFRDHTSSGGPALCTTTRLFRYSTSQGLLIAKISVWSKNWFNKLKAYLPLVTNLVRILIEEIVLLLNCKPYHASVVWCGVPKKEEGLILNLNSNSKSAPGFFLFNSLPPRPSPPPRSVRRRRGCAGEGLQKSSIFDFW